MPDDEAGIDASAMRIIAAAREEFEQYGVRRTTVEQVARRAGVSRVTVHRKFAGKAGLVRAVVLDDIQRFAQFADPLWRSDGAAEDRLVETCAVAVMALRRNPLFNTLLRSEPEELLKQLSIDGEEIFTLACGVLAGRLRKHAAGGELPEVDVRLVSELIVRLGFSIVLLPFGVFPGESDDEIRRQVRAAVLPILFGRHRTA